MITKLRVDKWLWAVRIYKSRTLATEACKKSKIRLNEQEIKASHLIEPGQILEVRKQGFKFKYKVVQLIDKRVSSPLALACYVDLTSTEELNKYKSWFAHRSLPVLREKGSGRPTKKERRAIEDFNLDPQIHHGEEE